MIEIAMILDFFITDPKTKFHPIALIGTLINKLNTLFYKDSKVRGLIFSMMILMIVITITMVIELFKVNILIVILLFLGLSTRTLISESNKIYMELKTDNISKARKYTSYLVTRDTSDMNEEKLVLSAVESISENTVDGIISPMIYLIIGSYFGFPLTFLYFYKTISTLDSMIGYKNEKYKNFGFFSAKFDDVLNYIPARFASAVMLMAVGCLRLNVARSFRMLIRDSQKHASPNSGIPESIVAGALGIQFGGKVKYFDKIEDKPLIGENVNKACLEHIKSAQNIAIVSFFIIFIIYESRLFL